VTHHIYDPFVHNDKPHESEDRPLCSLITHRLCSSAGTWRYIFTQIRF